MGLCFMKPKNTIAPLKLDFAAEKKGGKAVSTVWRLGYLLAHPAHRTAAHRRDAAVPLY